ncbi:hypothetical protein KM043_008814 [Ampulex compressa]|nr:hypothetical protein KM043_008814 [Ampulex compressa]
MSRLSTIPSSRSCPTFGPTDAEAIPRRDKRFLGPPLTGLTSGWILVMSSDRSTIGRSAYGCFLALLLVSLSTNVDRVEGRKCACTSKACKEAGVDTCKTKFSCYTELILTADREHGENTTTRGCTEGATPLLCETKSWVTRSKPADGVDRPKAPWIRMPWPRLMCCDTHDYCNAERPVNASTWIQRRNRIDALEAATDYSGSPDGISSNREPVGSKEQDPAAIGRGREYAYPLPPYRIRPLHVAALVLAIAALISVLAACYVITRFLKSNRYVVGRVE